MEALSLSENLLYNPAEPAPAQARPRTTAIIIPAMAAVPRAAPMIVLLSSGTPKQGCSLSSQNPVVALQAAMEQSYKLTNSQLHCDLSNLALSQAGSVLSFGMVVLSW